MSQMQNIEKVFADIEDRKQAIETVCKRFNLQSRSAKTYYSAWFNRNKLHTVTIKEQVVKYLELYYGEATLNEVITDISKKIGAKKDTVYKYYSDWIIERRSKEKEEKEEKEEVYVSKYNGIPRQKFYIDDSKLWR